MTKTSFVHLRGLRFHRWWTARRQRRPSASYGDGRVSNTNNTSSWLCRFSCDKQYLCDALWGFRLFIHIRAHSLSLGNRRWLIHVVNIIVSSLSYYKGNKTTIIIIIIIIKINNMISTPSEDFLNVRGSPCLPVGSNPSAVALTRSLQQPVVVTSYTNT